MRLIPNLTAVLCAAVVAPAAAQTMPIAPAAPVSATAAADPFAQAIAARQVAEFARRQKDVTAMVTAARMLQEIPFADTMTEAGTGGAAFTPAGLFAEAKTMAGGNPMILQQISVAQSTASRGVTASAFGQGLVRSVQTVNPLGAYRFSVTATGGSRLRVGAIGDLGTALALRVQDAGGRTLCLDDNADYAPVCQLTPRATGQYRIDIVNKSTAKSRAVILSN